MGKGDKKTRKGKLFSGSYGILRPRKRRPDFSVVGTTKKAAPEPKKPKTESKPAVEPVVEEKAEAVVAKEVPAKEAKPEAKKPAAKEEKPEAEAVAEKKPAAKKPAAKKPAEKKPAAKKETKPKEEVAKEDAPKDKK